MDRPVTVAIIDDHEAITQMAREWLSHDRRIEVRYTGKTLTGIATAPSDRTVDVLVVDLELADGPATDRVAELARAGRRIVVYSHLKDQDLIRALIQAGVGAYLTKELSETKNHLIEAVLTVAAGRSYVTPNQAGDILAAVSKELSPRQKDVARLHFDGLTYTRIARKLGISESSVKQALERARRKYADAGRKATTREDFQDRLIEDGVVEI